ncbi:MAG: hypothetical protein FWG48_02790 [Oscillospiraceae bacterium]|nr:hypothetical protein [Oscillospiraceae bacterium]
MFARLNRNSAGTLTISSDGKFVAVDIMNDALAFYLSKIEIYSKEQTGGSWGATWVPQEISSVPDSLWSIKSVSIHEVEFTLPDETPVKIVYTALVRAEAGEETTLKNEISVEGYTVTVTSDAYTPA